MIFNVYISDSSTLNAILTCFGLVNRSIQRTQFDFAFKFSGSFSPMRCKVLDFHIV